MPCASLGKSNLLPSESEATEAREGGPSEARTQNVLTIINLIKNPKKVENRLDFHMTRCKLLLEIVFLTNRNPVSSSFQPYFNQKYTKTDQVCNYSFDSKYEIPAGALCLRFCWAFLYRLGIGFLVGPSCTRMGKRPAFFVFGNNLVRKIVKKHEVLQCLHQFARSPTSYHRSESPKRVAQHILERSISLFLYCQ